jgi:hypothetical protein
VPASGQLADHQEPADLCRPKTVPSRRFPQVTGLAFNDPSLGQQSLHLREFSALPQQRRQQTWLVRRSHAPIVLHICVYVDAEA